MSSNGGMEDSENEESMLIDAMMSAISMQKAAFSCGGQIPTTAIADEGEEHRFDDVAGLITSPPMVLRWDLPSGMYISCETSVLTTASRSNLFREARSTSNDYPGLLGMSC